MPPSTLLTTASNTHMLPCGNAPTLSAPLTMPLDTSTAASQLTAPVPTTHVRQGPAWLAPVSQACHQVTLQLSTLHSHQHGRSPCKMGSHMHIKQCRCTVEWPPHGKRPAKTALLTPPAPVSASQTCCLLHPSTTYTCTDRWPACNLCQIQVLHPHAPLRVAPSPHGFTKGELYELGTAPRLTLAHSLPSCASC
jgi:hypothetical protein